MRSPEFVVVVAGGHSDHVTSEKSHELRFKAGNCFDSTVESKLRVSPELVVNFDGGHSNLVEFGVIETQILDLSFHD